MSNNSGVLPGSKNDDGNCRSVDDFEKLSVISEGTFGTLYKCRDKATNEIYALKKFKMPADFEDGIPSAILREINIFNSLNHENITNSHGTVAGKQLDSNYLILDYCEYSLKDLIERNVEAIYSKAMVKYLMHQLFYGLEYIHGGLIMHRNICSKNILFNSKGVLKIGGFKDSRFFAKSNMTPGVTELNYRAPELLFQARSYLSAIDMWSAGCIFAELLLRQHLFSGDSEIEVLKSIFKVLGTPSEAIWPGFNELFHLMEVNGPALELENEQPYNNLRKFFGAETVSCCELINDLFLYYPRARLGAQDCLKSLYFIESPPASKPEDLALILRSLVDGAGPSGWNDPPPLSFSPCSLSSGKRNLLNKRVPFPLNQSTCSPQPSTEKYELPDSSSSVPSQTIASSTQDTIIPKESTESLNCSVPEEEILPFITKTFERILAENFDKHEKKRIDEINQRIKIMKDSWESKISPPVKQKMFALAQELSNGNADAALKIQCILMVDYLREVKQWMVGVKHIIEMERQNVSSPEVTSTDPN